MATNDTAGNTGAHRANGHRAPDTDAPTEHASPQVAYLQADIERTRADLADAVDQLTAKLDVKTRVRNSAADAVGNATSQLRKLQDQATDDEGKPTPTTLVVAGGALAAVMAVFVVAVWRRDNTSRRPKWRRR